MRMHVHDICVRWNENDWKLLLYFDDQATNRIVAPILSGFHGDAHRFCHEFNGPTLMIKLDNKIYFTSCDKKQHLKREVTIQTVCQFKSKNEFR
jgi:hypothetical protein